jgi:drug/metabolite transporter (DMT)-like permease
MSNRDEVSPASAVANIAAPPRARLTRPLLRGALYGLGAAAIWGGMYVVSDEVLKVVPPFTLLATRLVISCLVLGALAAGSRQRLDLGRRDLAVVLGIGIVGFGISLGAQFVGTDRSTAVNGALITSASPAFIVLFAALLLRERLTRARVAAVALATLGVIVIIDPTRTDFSSATTFGDLMLAVAALTWGLYSVLIRQASERISTNTLSLLAPAGGLVLVLPAMLLELRTQAIGAITPAILLGILYLGVISTAAAMWMWNRAFALVPASTASLFFFAQPLVGTVLSVLLQGQAMTLPLLLGGTLIGIGVLVALRR